MTERMFIIDAMAFAFRSYFAIRTALTDSKGRPTNAIYGFARILLKLLREHTPSHLVVVFDAPGRTFREDLYADYKATRRETPQDLVDQFPRMHELVHALDIKLLCVPGVEADDVIGTLARQATEHGMEAVVVTGDKDMLQLINPHIRVFDPQKGDTGLWYGREEVIERFGVGPEHVVDALALIGDTADNVPGVRGIGDKTAKTLMEKFGSLEGLYEHIGELKGKQKERLEEDREQAFFSRELVTILTEVPIECSLDDCKRRELDPEKVIQMLNDFEFHTLLDELFPQGVPAGDEERLDYRCVLTEAELRQAVDEIRAAGLVAVDTETTGIDPMRAELVGISLSTKGQSGYYIPVAHVPDALVRFRDPDDLTTAELCSQLPLQRIIEVLGPVLADPAIGKVGHNIKYDLIMLERSGMALEGIVMDTMVASYLTDPSRLRHNLDEVSLQYLRRKLIPITDLIGKGSKAITFDQVPLDRACEYACEDADITWRLYGHFREQLRERALEELFREVEIPLIDVLARMEKAGITIDLEVFESLRKEIEVRLGGLVQEIIELAGESFTINSPKQLQQILFDKLKLKPLRKTKTGYSTDVDVLEELAREHPLPKKVLEYRMLEKLRGTYVEALPKLIHPRTGRIHTSFNQAVAATGRLSSSDPNLQNIPVRNEFGRRIREGFVPANEHYRLISADYSQIELRILAHLSGDAALKKAFEADEDIHRETAARVFGLSPAEVTTEMRYQAKAVNFGVVYGMSAFGLARNLGITNAEASRFIDAYFKLYPGVRAWLDDTLLQAREKGYVTTLLQRRRYLPELHSPDRNARGAAERMAINTPVQGSAADIIKIAMIRLDRALREFDATLLLQVHDELVVEARAEEADKVAGVMRTIMENAVRLEVPMRVDVGVGRHWAEIH